MQVLVFTRISWTAWRSCSLSVSVRPLSSVCGQYPPHARHRPAAPGRGDLPLYAGPTTPQRLIPQRPSRSSSTILSAVALTGIHGLLSTSLVRRRIASVQVQQESNSILHRRAIRPSALAVQVINFLRVIPLIQPDPITTWASYVHCSVFTIVGVAIGGIDDSPEAIWRGKFIHHLCQVVEFPVDGKS